MHRFHVPPGHCNDSEIVLTEREAHHGLHVVRVRRDEPVIVLDGAGTEYQCAVAELSRHTIRLVVRQKTAIPRLPYQLTLLQAIPKGKVFDSIVQKATELGAHRIIPVLTERVIAQLEGDKAESKVEHWRTVAIEAIKQCGSAWLPRIETPLPLKSLVASAPLAELCLVASLQPGSRQPGEWFDEFRSGHRQPPSSVAIWVGPEGDFTAKELAAIESAGAHPITLGRLVLRSETAAIYCLSVASHELQASNNTVDRRPG